MGRPSLKKERFEEILNAFEQCVARYGLAGATLDQIALQAGIARPLIRHHVGNKNDLIEALITRFMCNSQIYIKAMVDHLPEQKRLNVFIDRLFNEKYFDRNLILVTEALIAAASDYPKLEKQLIIMISEIQNVIAAELEQAYPLARQNEIDEVAVGILGIYFNVDSLTLLDGLESLRSNSKQAAIRLASTLATG